MFKRVFYSKQSLKYKKTLRSQRPKVLSTVLLKFVFEDESIGYSSFKPWEHLGDKDIGSQLSLLKKREFSSLTKKSLFHARIDAKYRALKKNPFSRFKEFLKTNFLIPVSGLRDLESGKCYKIKLGSQKKEELEVLKSLDRETLKNLSLRFDFEGLLDLDELKDYLPCLHKFKDNIEYIEDPFKEPSAYFIKELKSLTDIPLAIDRVTVPDSALKEFEYRIVKPSKDDLSYLYNQSHFKKIVFTSYMEHELSILASYYEALDFYEKSKLKALTSGFSTFLLFSDSLFGKAFRIEDGILIPNYMNTFGFFPQEILESLSWSEL